MSVCLSVCLSVSHLWPAHSLLQECCEASPQEHTKELLRVREVQVDQYHRLLVRHLREHECLGSDWAGQLAEEDRRQAQPAMHIYCAVCVCVCDVM